jgi:type IV pilus assembly protein PilF
VRNLVASVLVAGVLAGCASQTERAAEQAKRRQAVDTQVQLGAAYLQRERYDIAKQHLDRALELDSDDSQANNVMAVLKWKLKDYDGAERYFRRALDRDDKNPAIYHNYGAFLCERGRLDEGVRMLDRVVNDRLYVAAADANVNAGICLMTKPAPAAAEKYFREALRTKPAQASALYHMARISFDGGNALNARGFLQRYFQSAEDSPEALLLAVRVETAMKDKDAAASFALRLKSKFPTSSEAQQLARESAAREAQRTPTKR